MLAGELDVLEGGIQGVVQHSGQIDEQIDLPMGTQLLFHFGFDAPEIFHVERSEYAYYGEPAFMLDCNHRVRRHLLIADAQTISRRSCAGTARARRECREDVPVVKVVPRIAPASKPRI